MKIQYNWKGPPETRATCQYSGPIFKSASPIQETWPQHLPRPLRFKWVLFVSFLRLVVAFHIRNLICMEWCAAHTVSFLWDAYFSLEVWWVHDPLPKMNKMMTIHREIAWVPLLSYTIQRAPLWKIRKNHRKSIYIWDIFVLLFFQWKILKYLKNREIILTEKYSLLNYFCRSEFSPVCWKSNLEHHTMN